VLSTKNFTRTAPIPAPTLEPELVGSFTPSRSNGLITIRTRGSVSQPASLRDPEGSDPEPEAPFIRPPSRSQLMPRR
jgi:hypothetical protein